MKQEQRWMELTRGRKSSIASASLGAPTEVTTTINRDVYSEFSGCKRYGNRDGQFYHRRRHCRLGGGNDEPG